MTGSPSLFSVSASRTYLGPHPERYEFAIRGEEWAALLDVVEAARNPDVFNIFDDAKAYPAQKALAEKLAVFRD